MHQHKDKHFRTSLYLSEAVGNLLRRKCSETSLTFSNFTSQAIVSYVEQGGLEHDLEELEYIRSLQKLIVVEMELKLNLKKAFFDSNMKVLMMKVIAKAVTKQDIIDVLKSFMKIAVIFNHDYSKNSIKDITDGINSSKRLDTARDHARKFIGKYMSAKDDRDVKRLSK